MLDLLHHWLFEVPIVRLFVIIAVDYLLGEVRFPGGFRLGVAGVLFVGLACGALSPSLGLPGEFQTLGLVLFVYCIGLQAAPGFLKSFRRDGLKLNGAVVVALVVSFAVVVLCARWSGRPAGMVAGAFCGALTTTPGLGAVTETLAGNGSSPGDVDLAVVGYGVSYPIALLVVLVMAGFLSRRSPETRTASASLPSGPATVSMTCAENSDENDACRAYNARPQADSTRVAASLPTAKSPARRRITPANRLDTHEVAQNRFRCFLLHPHHA